MGSIADLSEVLLTLGLDASCTERERAIADWALDRAEGAVRRHLRYDPVQRSRTELYPIQDFGSGAAEAVWEATTTEAYLRYLSEASTNELLVLHIPIRSTPAIDLRIDYDARNAARSDSFGADTVKVEGSDYWPNYDRYDSAGNRICSDGIIRSVGRWPTSAGSVRIVYTAGYSQAELHGQDAVIDASPILDAVVSEAERRAKAIFLKQKSGSLGWTAGPFRSEKLGDYSYTIGMSSEAMDRLYGGKFDLLPETKERLGEFVHFGEMAL